MNEPVLIFDIETNGLLNDLTLIHCIAIYDSSTQETLTYNDQGCREPITKAVQRLEDAEYIVGHNIIGYDIPAISKLFPWFTVPSGVRDTLVLSNVYHPDLVDIDKKRKWKGMPPRLYGSHSLEAYGYRLNLNKGDYAKETDWKDWSQEMEDYCVRDVEVTVKLCKHFIPFLTSSN